MDEIIIEEKKYISSKQASRITGYAKDYIGQLCREGRVPARLVGRSWYVLESAIQDHRFGNQEVAAGNTVPEPVKPMSAEHDWGSFHYEAQTEEVVPSVYGEHVESINQLQKRNSLGFIDHNEDIKQETIATEVSQSLHEAWSEWFSAKSVPPTVESSVIPDVSTAAEPERYEEDRPAEEEDAQMEAEGESVDIPLTIVNYQQVPEKEVLPALQKHEKKQVPMPQERQRRESRPRSTRWIQLCSCSVAIVFVALAVSGSGYLDKYLASSSVGQMFSGFTVYER